MATQYRTRARIKAPLDTVWRVLTDVEHIPEWTPSMKSVRIVEGTGFGVGTKVEIRQPRMIAMTWTVEEVVPGRHFRWAAVSPGVVTHGDHWLEPRANGRHTEARLEIRHTGALAWLIGALTMRRTARYVDLEMQGLMTASEAASSAADPHRR